MDSWIWSAMLNKESMGGFFLYCSKKLILLSIWFSVKMDFCACCFKIHRKTLTCRHFSCTIDFQRSQKWLNQNINYCQNNFWNYNICTGQGDSNLLVTVWAEENVISPQQNLFGTKWEMHPMPTFLTWSQRCQFFWHGRSLRFGREIVWHTKRSSDSSNLLSSSESVSGGITSTTFLWMDIPLVDCFGLNATLVLTVDFWLFYFTDFVLGVGQNLNFCWLDIQTVTSEMILVWFLSLQDLALRLITWPSYTGTYMCNSLL